MSLEICIIDDEAMACQRLERLLQQCEEDIMRIDKWTRPEKALKQVQSQAYDLIFLDVEMPGLSGLEFIQELKGSSNFPKVVFTTAYDQYVLKALRAHAFDYLLKPIDLDELKAVFKRLNETKEETFKSFENLAAFGLSEREIEIAKLIFNGMSSKEIGEQLFISKTTVDKHRSNILHKTNCKNTTELFTLL